MIDFSVPIKAGLTQTELAKVLGVSRVTLNMWLHGKMKPHRLHAKDIESRMELVMRAINLNLIPPKPRRGSRDAAIAVAVEKANIRPLGELLTEA
jgi:DNA-binding XRE family transcriptional regulator